MLAKPRALPHVRPATAAACVLLGIAGWVGVGTLLWLASKVL